MSLVDLLEVSITQNILPVEKSDLSKRAKLKPLRAASSATPAPADPPPEC